jgi:DNA adenine methylase
VTPAARPSPSGHYSPLRYPGGKGKLARFVADIIRLNGLEDGLYVEPYAGGAAVALELLLTGIVRRIAINDLSRPIYAFWMAVLEQAQELATLIRETEVSMETRDHAKRVLMRGDAQGVELAFATFFLNRTNRSGILNGGAIGGIDQTGPWKIDARYNKEELIYRINKISRMRGRISLTNLDAIKFINSQNFTWPTRTLVYLDPPYYKKGRDLYYNFYNHQDHIGVALATAQLRHVRWMVSYDDVAPIHVMYEHAPCLRYTIGYSARERGRGTEAMFFSAGLQAPPVRGSMIELSRRGLETADEIKPAPASQAQ